MRPNAKKWSRHRLVLALFFLNSCICIETRFHTDSTLGGVIWKAFYLLRNCNKWVLSCFIYTRGTNRLPEVFRAICVFIFFAVLVYLWFLWFLYVFTLFYFFLFFISAFWHFISYTELFACGRLLLWPPCWSFWLRASRVQVVTN